MFRFVLVEKIEKMPLQDRMIFTICAISSMLVFRYIIPNHFTMTTVPAVPEETEITYEATEIDSRTLKFIPRRQNQRLDFKQFFTLLQEEQFLENFIGILQNLPFEGYYFECPPVNSQNFDQKSFEFVIVKSKTLQFRRAEKEDFEDYFTEDENVPAVGFENLGKDAFLIAPNPWPTSKLDIYSHLGSFMKKGSKGNFSIFFITKSSICISSITEQMKGFWKVASKMFLEEIKRKASKNIWLSTAGDGVAWLHLRMDTRPKYYQYVPYYKDHKPLLE